MKLRFYLKKISLCVSIALERMNIARIEWSSAVGGLFSGFGVSLFLFYSLTPWVIRMSSAVVLNLSLLTADFYTLIFGLFLFEYKVRRLGGRVIQQLLCFCDGFCGGSQLDGGNGRNVVEFRFH